jgi:hypothetical protein
MTRVALATRVHLDGSPADVATNGAPTVVELIEGVGYGRTNGATVGDARPHATWALAEGGVRTIGPEGAGARELDESRPSIVLSSEVATLPQPSPGHGSVLVWVNGTGACGSAGVSLAVIDHPEIIIRYLSKQPPYSSIEGAHTTVGAPEASRALAWIADVSPGRVRLSGAGGAECVVAPPTGWFTGDTEVEAGAVSIALVYASVRDPAAALARARIAEDEASAGAWRSSALVFLAICVLAFAGGLVLERRSRPRTKGEPAPIETDRSLPPHRGVLEVRALIAALLAIGAPSFALVIDQRVLHRADLWLAPVVTLLAASICALVSRRRRLWLVGSVAGLGLPLAIAVSAWLPEAIGGNLLGLVLYPAWVIGPLLALAVAWLTTAGRAMGARWRDTSP